MAYRIVFLKDTIFLCNLIMTGQKSADLYLCQRFKSLTNSKHLLETGSRNI